MTNLSKIQTILVEDDNDEVRELMCRALTLSNYHILTATDGATGLAIYKQYQAEIDLVILDMMMPHMNGLELFKALQQWDSQIKCLMITGNAPDPLEIELLKDKGLQGFIRKPFSLKDLDDLIKEVFQNCTIERQSI